jgi:PPOX class probable FMN-dependent enzyme
MVTATTFRDTITTFEQLRELIPAPDTRIDKEIDFIDEHARAFIAKSPFALIATSNAEGRCDVSPKGDAAGFVHVLDEHTIVIPDRPGNQRADSLRNIIENPRLGMLMIIPGVEWTLRVNGRATIVRDAELLDACAANGKRPTLAIAVHVEEVFLHCPKCFMRSRLWDTDGWMPSEEQPSWAEILRTHTNLERVPLDAFEQALNESNTKLY